MLDREGWQLNKNKKEKNAIYLENIFAIGYSKGRGSRKNSYLLVNRNERKQYESK